MSQIRRRIAGAFSKASDLEPDDEVSRKLYDLSKQIWNDHKTITVIVRRPGGPLELREIQNDIRSFYDELKLDGPFDIGTPFPSYDPLLRVIVGDESLLDGSRINFLGESQYFCGNVLFARQYGPDLGSLAAEDITFLSKALHHPVRICYPDD